MIDTLQSSRPDELLFASAVTGGGLMNPAKSQPVMTGVGECHRLEYDVFCTVYKIFTAYIWFSLAVIWCFPQITACDDRRWQSYTTSFAEKFLTEDSLKAFGDIEVKCLAFKFGYCKL